MILAGKAVPGPGVVCHWPCTGSSRQRPLCSHLHLRAWNSACHTIGGGACWLGDRDTSGAFCVAVGAQGFTGDKTNFCSSKNSNINEICIQSSRCKSGCCRRAPEICESYCSRRGSEGHLCHTQMFSGLYNECPCQLNLTCVFPKNQKSFHIIYGRCQKMAKKKQTKKGFF
uniref:Colipase like 1 n=1 Tax=Oryctolagus cuniculus TaxID=9986 RepID=A0A5F9DLT9_RABIT